MEREQAAKQEKQQANINLWSELEGNLLGEILSRLSLTDQARFRVVCKNWLAAHPINTKTLLPWYLSFDHSLTLVTRRLDFQLYDPSSSNLASVHSISLTKLGFPSSSLKNIAATVKHNWLFICTRKGRLFSRNRRYILLLFSPFARKVITLPKFNYPRHFKFKVMFSTQPDSPDCVFFLLDTCKADKIALLTYRNGDKEWTAKQFNKVTNFMPCFCHLVYLCGMLYIVSPYGQLASYNIVGGEFKFERVLIDELLALNFRSSRVMRVLELNGELLILYLSSNNAVNVPLPGKQCIKRYDRSTKAWIPVSTLGNKALFVSNKTYEVATINILDTRNNEVLSNKIYHFFDGGCRVYSLEDGELVEFRSTDSNLLEDGDTDFSEYKNNYGMTFSDTKKSVYWLEPPSVRVCSS